MLDYVDSLSKKKLTFISCSKDSPGMRISLAERFDLNGMIIILC